MFSRSPLADRGELRTRPRRRLRQALDPARFSSWRPKPQKSTGPEKGGRQRRRRGRIRPPIGGPRSTAILAKAAEFLRFRGRSTNPARVPSQGALAEGGEPKREILYVEFQRLVEQAAHTGLMESGSKGPL